MQGIPRSFHPEIVSFTRPGANLSACLRGGLQVASARTLDFLDIGKTMTRPGGVERRTRSV